MIIEYIFQAFFKFLTLCAVYLFFDCYVLRKDINRKQLLVCAAAASLVSTCIFFIFMNTNINLVITIISIAVIANLFETKLGIKILLGSIYLIFNILVEYFQVVIFSSLLSISLQQVTNNHLSIYLMLSVEFIIIYFILYCLKRRRKTIEAEGDSVSYISLSIIPMVSIGILYVMLYIQSASQSISVTLIYAIMLALIMINAVLHFTFLRVNKLFENKKEQKYLEQEIQYKEEYYKKLEQHQIEVRTIRHDLKNQLIGIGAKIKHSSTDMAMEEIEHIIDSVQKVEQIMYTKHVVVNAVLNVKRDKAIEAKRIECQFNVHVPEHIHVRDMDIGILLGNILDNAIEACEKVDIKQPVIILDLFYYNGCLTIKIENSIEDQVNELVTAKKDKVNHGLGLNSVRKIISKYNGYMEYVSTKERFQLSINLWDRSKVLRENDINMTSS